MYAWIPVMEKRRQASCLVSTAEVFFLKQPYLMLQLTLLQ
jgi:hypothetical protein